MEPETAHLGAKSVQSRFIQGNAPNVCWFTLERAETAARTLKKARRNPPETENTLSLVLPINPPAEELAQSQWAGVGWGPRQPRNRPAPHSLFAVYGRRGNIWLYL